MKPLFFILSTTVALAHFFFLLLESYFWTKPLGRSIFKLSREAAENSKTLALNQGFYNGVLGAGILWGLIRQDFSVTVFCLMAVVVVGLVGAVTVSSRIFLVQSLPAILALISFFFTTSAGHV